MKRFLIILLAALFLLPGCHTADTTTQIVTTTAPVYEFTKSICKGTDIQVAQLITESVSCLHDYTLQSGQMHILETADMVIISGSGLEEFLGDALKNTNNIIDASYHITPLCTNGHTGHDHHHDEDPHVWLSPNNAVKMAECIYTALLNNYPEFQETFQNNYLLLSKKFEELSKYAADNLTTLSCRDLITFHDGFSYMADAFDLHILRAIEEESGSEASAADLISICQLIKEHKISAIFTEKNGSDSAAKIISNETGAKIYTLDMAMSGSGYFEAMYHNINTLKEALE